MDFNVSDFFLFLKTKKVAFIGMGVTNFLSIRLFLSKGIDVTVLDKNENNLNSQNGITLKDDGAKFIVGEHYLDNLCDFDIVIRSPGVYFYNEKLQEAIKSGVIVTSELEIFFMLAPCKIIGITGSDGKTTTTSLIYEYLKEDGKTVYLGGNIGIPILPIIEKLNKYDIVVLELSSFQLISMRCSPEIGVITNISPNHLDVHGTLEEYIFSKQNIILHQNAFCKAILNKDNQTSYEQSKFTRANVLFFSRTSEVSNGSYFDTSNDTYYFIKNDKKTKIMTKDDTSLIGVHNIENYLAAIAAVFDIVNINSIRKVSKNFKGVKHRIEFVRNINGVKWYNDSIATTPTRTLALLNSFDKKIILIAGGYDKKLSYDILAPSIIKKVKHLILLGNTASKINDALIAYPDYKEGSPSIHFVGSMDNAVILANELAKEGDIVSLSPASASFDLYKNFEERGEHFKSLVSSL